MRNVLIYGAGSFGHTARNLVELVGYHFVSFIDDFAKEYRVIDYREALKGYSSLTHCIVNAIGYKYFERRWEINEQVKSDGYKALSLIHPKAIVDKTAQIGDGAIIMAGAIVGYKAVIGELSVLWQGVVVEHNSQVGSNTFLSPHATICGDTKIGNGCFVGAGAIVTDRQVISDNSFLKAGRINNVSIRRN